MFGAVDRRGVGAGARGSAERIAAEGGAVVVADIAAERAEAAAAAITSSGGSASAFAVDVSDEARSRR